MPSPVVQELETRRTRHLARHPVLGPGSILTINTNPLHYSPTDQPSPCPGLLNKDNGLHATLMGQTRSGIGIHWAPSG